jgi:dihydrodipicolinate synthase/N-acetylneuraminate lyase
MCNTTTPFTAAGGLDEDALRRHLRRMVAARTGVFLGSPGSGEMHTLSDVEFGRVCEIAVDECGGRVPVYAMTGEVHDAAATIRVGRIAAAAGVDAVQIFQVMGGHGMVATRDEQEAYFDTVLAAIDHPVAISFHGIAGYLAPVDLVAKLYHDVPSLCAVYVYMASWTYLSEVRDAVPSHIPLGVEIAGAVQSFALGAHSMTGAEPNVIPVTCRALVDAYEASDIAEVEVLAQRIQRLSDAVRRWRPLNSRWIKMALRVLELPGGEGGVRAPLVLPDESELAMMAQAFDRLGVRDWER